MIGFKWRNFIEISDDWGAQERADIEAELDKLEPLHLMQETLRDIPLNKLYDWQPNKIAITPNNQYIGYDGCGRMFYAPPDLMIGQCYRCGDDGHHKVSLARLILHELQHAIDPDFTQRNSGIIASVSQITGYSEVDVCNYYAKKIDTRVRDYNPKNLVLEGREEIDAIMQKNSIAFFWNEHINMSRENPTMQYFFDEPRRAAYDGVDMTEKYRMLSAQPNANYRLHPEKNVNEPITEVCLDIKWDYAEEAKESADWRMAIEKKRKAGAQNFPNGNTRYY